MEALNSRTINLINRLKKMKEINNSLNREQRKSINLQIKNLSKNK